MLVENSRPNVGCLSAGGLVVRRVRTGRPRASLFSMSLPQQNPKPLARARLSPVAAAEWSPARGGRPLVGKWRIDPSCTMHSKLDSAMSRMRPRSRPAVGHGGRTGPSKMALAARLGDPPPATQAVAIESRSRGVGSFQRRGGVGSRGEPYGANWGAVRTTRAIYFAIWDVALALSWAAGSRGAHSTRPWPPNYGACEGRYRRFEFRAGLSPHRACSLRRLWASPPYDGVGPGAGIGEPFPWESR